MLLFNFADVKSRLLVQVSSNLRNPSVQPYSLLYPYFVLTCGISTLLIANHPCHSLEHGCYLTYDCIDLLNSNLILIKT